MQFLSNSTVDKQGNVYVIASFLRSTEPIPGLVFGYSKSGEKIIEFVIEFVRKPFAPLLLPDGSLVIAGLEDVKIVCVSDN